MYKRQVARCFHIGRRGDHYFYLFHRSFVCTGAVSYTHLDVYKRQISIRVITALAKSYIHLLQDIMQPHFGTQASVV